MLTYTYTHVYFVKYEHYAFPSSLSTIGKDIIYLYLNLVRRLRTEKWGLKYQPTINLVFSPFVFSQLTVFF